MQANKSKQVRKEPPKVLNALPKGLRQKMFQGARNPQSFADMANEVRH